MILVLTIWSVLGLCLGLIIGYFIVSDKSSEAFLVVITVLLGPLLWIVFSCIAINLFIFKNETER